METHVDAEYVLDAETMRRIRSLHLKMAAQVTELVSGEYRSAFRGSGIEFEEVRPYQPGDDVRAIDWNVTARQAEPYIKLFREEREMTVMLVVDLSASGLFGSRKRLKRELVAEAGAALAFAAVRNRDKVGVVGFADGIELHIPPRKGSGHVWRIVRALLGAPGGPGTELADALEFVGRVQRRKAAIFVLSDFLSEGWDLRMRTLAARHDVTAVVVEDERKRVWESAGLLRLRDPETGAEAFVDTSDERAARRFATVAAERVRRRDQAFKRCGVGRLVLGPGDSVIDELLAYFRRRELRR